MKIGFPPKSFHHQGTASFVVFDIREGIPCSNRRISRLVYHKPRSSWPCPDRSRATLLFGTVRFTVRFLELLYFRPSQAPSLRQEGVKVWLETDSDARGQLLPKRSRMRMRKTMKAKLLPKSKFTAMYLSPPRVSPSILWMRAGRVPGGTARNQGPRGHDARRATPLGPAHPPFPPPRGLVPLWPGQSRMVHRPSFAGGGVDSHRWTGR